MQSIPDLSLWKLIYTFGSSLMVGLAIAGVLFRQRELEARLDALDGGEMETSERIPKNATVQPTA